jgi:hypothetical protein
MATTFSQREVSILKTLFRVTKPSMTMEVLTRPTMIMEEGKTGFVSVRRVPDTLLYESIYTPEAEKGPKSKEILSATAPSFGLRFSPTINKSTALIQLEIQATTAQLGELVQLDQVTSVHETSVLTYELAPVTVPSAGTIAVGCTLESDKDKTKREWLWLLETHIVRGKN